MNNYYPPQPYYYPVQPTYNSSTPNYNLPTSSLPLQPLTPQVTPIRGRMVSSPDEVIPAEVLMDGQVYFFPKNDFTCIYAKTWDKNGKLQTFKFVPETTIENSDEPQVTLNDLNSRLDKIEKMLERRKQWNDRKQETNQTQKEIKHD